MDGDTESVPTPAATRPSRRRRFLVAICVGAALAAAGAWAGSSWKRPRYRSEAMIQVSRRVPRIVYAIDEKQDLPMYDEFLETQAELVTSRRVADMAMRSAAWQRLGRGVGDADVAQFVGSVAAARRPRSEYVAISFTDEDPTAAMVAVNQIVIAYMKLVDEHECESDITTLNRLNSQRDIVNSQLHDVRASADAATDGSGQAGFESELRAAADRLAKTNEALVDLDLQVARSAGAVASNDVVRQRERIQALRTAAIQDMQRLARQRNLLDAINAEAATLTARANDIKRRLYEIRVESGGHGRITVASTGDRPVNAEPGGRRRDAAIGAGAGLVLGVGLTLLAGLTSARSSSGVRSPS